MDGGLNTERSDGAPREDTRVAERIALAIFAGAAAYFLWTEHRAHVVEYLPWGILALCPLMHFFMHRGYGHESSREPDRGNEGTGQGR